MTVGAVSSILDGMHQGSIPLTDGVVAISRQQAAMNTRLLVEMYALKMSTGIQDAAVLALIQQALGVGQNVDYFA